MNKAILIGRLTKDPELKFAPGGLAIANFSIAIDRRVKKDGNKETDFIPVVVFGKSAEYISNYASKGKLVAVEGEIRTSSYEAKDGSGKRYKTEVYANSVQILEWDKKTSSQNTSANDTGFDDMMAPVDDEEIPF